jgi:hypothetical protein
VIGRTGPVDRWALIRWARAQAVAHELKPLDAHVLLVLATYANSECEAWPSIKTLALDCGLKPTPPRPRKDGKASAWRNNQISVALDRLQEKQLIWSTRRGPGQPAVRELLFNPDALASGQPDGMPSGKADVKDPPGSLQPSERQDGLTSGGQDRNNQTARAQTATTTTQNNQLSSHPVHRTATDPASRTSETPEQVSEAIRESLEQARARRARPREAVA